MIDSPTRPKPKGPVRALVSTETEAERLDIDMAYHRFKVSGGHHRDNDAQALRLQQQYQTKDYP